MGARLPMAGPEEPNNGIHLPPIRSKAETLTYLCEIIIELRQLAEKSGCRSLAAILGAALIEARIQREIHNR
jgi:hypothetical protein